MLTIEPKENSELPSFSARWDQNSETLDVDILNVDSDTSSLFEAGKDGYSGHHPLRISEEVRMYDVIIKTPRNEIFRGNVSFNINHGHAPNLFG